MRYTVNVKAKIIASVNKGETTLDEVCALHNITADEYAGWVKSMERAGKQALRVTRCQFYRAAGI